MGATRVNQSTKSASAGILIAGSQGASLASAATIAITDSIHEITGAVDIATINGGKPNQILALVKPTGATWNVLASGNVESAVSLAANTVLYLFTLDGSSWYPLTTAGALSVVDFISFSTTYGDANPPPAASMNWSDADGTLQIGLKGGNVILQVGQEQVVRVLNKTGVQIDNGDVVYINGSQGNRPTVALADADGAHPADVPTGVATEDIADNASGYITTQGLVRDIDTSSWAAGTVLYLSTTPGAMTSTAPVIPAEGPVIAIVTYQHATNGVILVTHDGHKHWSDMDTRYVNVAGDTMTGDLVLTKAAPQIKFDDSGSSTDFSWLAASSSFRIYDSTAGTYPFWLEAGAPNYSVYIDSDGKLGVGTSNPAYLIEAESNSINPTIAATNTAAASTANKGILNVTLQSSTQQRAFLNMEVSASDIVDATRTTKVDFLANAAGTYGSKMTLLGDKLGIGTTPSYRLHVKSSGGNTFPLVITNSAGNTIAGILEDVSNHGVLRLYDSSTTQQIELDASTGAIYERARTVAMGEWTDVAHSAGDYTSASTWTVDAGDLIEYSYTIVGKTATVCINITNTDVGVAPGGALIVALPAAITPSHSNTWVPAWVRNAGAAKALGLARATSTGTIAFYTDPTAAAAWTATTGDDTDVACLISFEIT